MGQVTIYLDDEHEHRLRRAAKSAGMPVSHWVAKLVAEKTRNEWPDSVHAMAGAWEDFPTAEELREAGPTDRPRESL